MTVVEKGDHVGGTTALSGGTTWLPAREVESVLAEHPVVGAVAAPDPRCTEVPAAFVELHPGVAVTAEQLQEHRAAVLARFTVPRHVRFVTEWPMSATTIQEGPLRERITAELVDGKEHA